MKAIQNGSILTPDGPVSGKALVFDQKIIGIADPSETKDLETIDAGGLMIAPGLLDLHIHGYLGEDTSDAREEGIRKIAEGLLQNGVTSFLPTTMTVRWEEIEAALEVVRRLKTQSAQTGFQGSQILGAHAEGPFINPKRKGAQAEECIIPPDADRLLSHQDIIKIVTMAPEMRGGMDFIKMVTTQSGIVVSIGHTDASFEQAMQAIHAGASYVTHTFNAMTGLSHRAPGVVGAALSAPVFAEIIADTFHVHPGLFGLMRTAKGEKLLLVTDCTRAGGLGDGEYTLGGQPIFVKGIECRLKDGTIAGSVLRLNQAVLNLKNNTTLDWYEAVNHASLYPARAIGEDHRKGSLEQGKDADIVLFDQQMQAMATYVGGTLKYRRETT